MLSLNGYIGNRVPAVDGERAKRLYTSLSRAVDEGLVASCHDCSDGGLGVALLETAFSGGLGMTIDLACVPSAGIDRNDYCLFSESQSRFIVTISPEAQDAFETVMGGNLFGFIGRITPEKRIVVTGMRGNVIINEDIDDLKKAWQAPLNF